MSITIYLILFHKIISLFHKLRNHILLFEILLRQRLQSSPVLSIELTDQILYHQQVLLFQLFVHLFALHVLLTQSAHCIGGSWLQIASDHAGAHRASQCLVLLL